MNYLLGIKYVYLWFFKQVFNLGERSTASKMLRIVKCYSRDRCISRASYIIDMEELIDALSDALSVVKYKDYLMMISLQ